jgi:hypothetical protein
MKLTDDEIREINSHLDAGTPLPDRYRSRLFGEKPGAELVWNGKTRDVCDTVLPLEVVERVGRSPAGDSAWANKLILGDNKLILSSLTNGPLRAEIERQGGLKLIYIDPPFDVGADFSMGIELGESTATRRPNTLEEIAYRDTWGDGADSFLAMMYERLVLMHDLLAPDGSIYVHCDRHVTGYVRLLLDEVFGKDNQVSEIIWQRITSKSNVRKKYGAIHDTIYFYARDARSFCWNQPYRPLRDAYVDQMYRYADEKTGRRYRVNDLTSSMS